MSSWADLLATALVGTDRRGGSGPGAAAAVLDEAAAWGVYRRAGLRAVRGLAAPQPAPGEARPVVPAAAAARLATLVELDLVGVGLVGAAPAVGLAAMGFPVAGPLGDGASGIDVSGIGLVGIDDATRIDLVAEWLDTAGRRGLRAPPESLPALFDLARRVGRLRPLVVVAGGARVTWLATQNPEWTFMTTSADESGTADPRTWHEGTAGQRVGFLTALRRTDPDAARDLLTADWTTIASQERAQLLAVFDAGLGSADEEFLDHALDDRRSQVRATAARLLAALPGSRLSARMADRARRCLTVRGRTLRVSPPGECDAAMRRDGLEPRPPAGTGERAWWLRQILARTRLGALTTAPPAEWLALSIEDDWRPVAWRGLAAAARDQRDTAWSAALLDRVGLWADDADQDLVDGLIDALAPEDVTARAVAALRNHAEQQDGTAAPRRDAAADRLTARLLARAAGPWPGELARAMLDTLEARARLDRERHDRERRDGGRREGGTRGRGTGDLHSLARLGAFRLPPTFADEVAAAAERLQSERPAAAAVLERLATVLALRHEMTQEFA